MTTPKRGPGQPVNAIRDYLAAIGAEGGKIGGKARSAAKLAAAKANGARSKGPPKGNQNWKGRKAERPSKR